MDYEITKKIIEQGKLLPEESMSFILDNISELQDNWEKKQRFRTETEMRISILNDIKHPTPASKYWQCIREQSVYYEQLVQLSFDYRKNRIEQERIRIAIKDIEKRVESNSNYIDEHKLDLEEAQIDLEEKQFTQLNMEQVAKDRFREIQLWSKIMKELDNGSFDTKDVNTHQLVSYHLRFQQQLKNMGTASPSETANLVGQSATAIRHLIEAGLLVEKPSSEICKSN